MNTCLRCNHQWQPRTNERVRQCPNCKSPRWDSVPTRVRGSASRTGATITVGVRVDPDLNAVLKAIAEAQDKPLARLYRAALEEYAKKYGVKLRAKPQ